MNDTPAEALAADDILNPEIYRPLYPKALLDDLAKELGIQSEEARSRFEDTVLFAAGVYKVTKNSLRRKAPRHRETKALEKIAKKAEELNEAILEAQQTGLAYPRLFACGLPKAKAAAVSSSSPEFRQILQILIRGNIEHMSMSPRAIQEIVEFLRHAAETAAQDESSVYFTHKNFPVEQWLRLFGCSWNEFTNLTFTVGRYYSKIGYKNKTLHILEKLLKPLDAKVTCEQVASALRKVAKETRENSCGA